MVILCSYNSGEVYGSEYAGGVVGTSYRGILTNCYNSAKVSGDSNIGGVLGSSPASVFYTFITNCYFNGDKGEYNALGSTANLTETNVVEMTDSEMKAENFVTTLNNNAYYYNQEEPTTLACGWAAVTLRSILRTPIQLIIKSTM